MSWLAEEINDYIQEITPINDLKEHYLMDECWCMPKVEYIENIQCSDGFVRMGMMFVHNSADGREEKEVHV